MSMADAARGALATLVVVALVTVAAWTVLGRQELADVVMLYLLGTVLISMRYGYGSAFGAAALSVLSFNFFFIPPYYTFAVADARHLVTFAVMFLVAVVISRLTKRVRDEADAARRFAEEAHHAAARAETEQLRSALLSSVSHDLRTPLAVVTGAASTLLGDAVSDPVRRDLTETILEEARRLDRLVKNLLDMTRLEAGAVSLKREWQPLEEVIGAAIARIEPLARGRTIGTDLPDDLPLVPFDAVLVEQVLVNLLENACRYTPAGAPIAISARVEDGAARIAVADRGPGISPGEEARIFEKFYRARPVPEGGAGLGLAICRAIVTAHGGAIAVVPTEPTGATFRFTLPIVGTPPALAPDP